MALKQLEAARKAACLSDPKRPLAVSKRMRREIMTATNGVEPDPVVRALCPVIAHKLFGRSGPDGLTAGQRRQVANFARDAVKALRLAGLVN